MIKFKHYPANVLKEHGIHPKSGGVTFCYEYDHEKAVLTYALAQCHKNDTYNKKEGRDVALDKYLHNEKIDIHMSKSAFMKKKHNFFTDLAYNLITNTH